MPKRLIFWLSLIGSLTLSLGFVVVVADFEIDIMIVGFGLMLGLLVHECGHCFIAKLCGATLLALVITPLGGFFIVDGSRLNLDDEAGVALAGPVFGLLYSLFFLLLYYLGTRFFGGLEILLLVKLICLLNALLNIVNLLPLLPFDGGNFLQTWIPGRWFVTGLLSLVMYVFAYVRLSDRVLFTLSLIPHSLAWSVVLPGWLLIFFCVSVACCLVYVYFHRDTRFNMHRSDCVMFIVVYGVTLLGYIGICFLLMKQ